MVGVTFFAAIALASVYKLTKEPIELSKKNREMSAIRSVLPPFDHLDPKPVEIDNGLETTLVYNAYNKMNNLVGAAVQSSSNNGFNGQIVIIAGFDKNARIVNYQVISQNETPGLGARMADWFKTNFGRQSIIGKNAATANLTVTKDGGEVDAISGATISSRAFLFAIRSAYQAFSSSLGNKTIPDSPASDEKTKAPTK